jgi:hypothetical protein
MSDRATRASTDVVCEEFKICNCTNTQIERGETCGLAICMNHPTNRLPRPDKRGEGK